MRFFWKEASRVQERLGCLRRPRSGAVRSFPAYEGDASVPTPHHPNPRPYGDEGASEAISHDIYA